MILLESRIQPIYESNCFYLDLEISNEKLLQLYNLSERTKRKFQIFSFASLIDLFQILFSRITLCIITFCFSDILKIIINHAFQSCKLIYLSHICMELKICLQRLNSIIYMYDSKYINNRRTKNNSYNINKQ
ncbi:unnamed protein product [Moneuplotes crassus]|uniref:Uncharacterized protein n=1 Tax=Euplotes crassus TaxID=5936 RepID=A0AAD1UP24_EUPCR|nr:unnamed protein product [Moneuplotes crassus]